MALNKVVGLAGRFRRDRGGNFMVMAGVVMGALALAVGFAVDVGQMMNARSALSNAIDAAVTSTARDLTTGTATEDEAKKIIKVYLDANSGGGILVSDRIVLDKVELDRTVRTLQVTAHVDVPLYFPLFGSDKTRRVSQTGAAAYSDRKLEVAMMLDVTFSMDGQKIADLKKAAKSAAEIFLSNQDSANPRKRLAIIPYSNSVNVGPLAAKSVFAEKNESDRLKTGGNTDAAMLKNKSVGNCATERPGPYQYKEDGPEVSLVHRDYYLDKYAEHYNTDPCPSSEIMPLTADLSAAQARIKGLIAVGGTAGHIGIQWTWYMLSEKWGSIMNASQRPAAKNPEKIGKFAILMTDGEFNLSYFDINNYLSAYNERGKIATREAAKTLCKAMRDSGIEIFSVGFHLTDANAKTTMKDCASPDSGKTKHYYETSTGLELEKAFIDIARNIEGLALTK